MFDQLYKRSLEIDDIVDKRVSSLREQGMGGLGALELPFFDGENPALYIAKLQEEWVCMKELLKLIVLDRMQLRHENYLILQNIGEDIPVPISHLQVPEAEFSQFADAFDRKPEKSTQTECPMLSDKGGYYSPYLSCEDATEFEFSEFKRKEIYNGNFCKYYVNTHGIITEENLSTCMLPGNDSSFIDMSPSHSRKISTSSAIDEGKSSIIDIPKFTYKKLMNR